MVAVFVAMGTLNLARAGVWATNEVAVGVSKLATPEATQVGHGVEAAAVRAAARRVSDDRDGVGTRLPSSLAHRAVLGPHHQNLLRLSVGRHGRPCRHVDLTSVAISVQSRNLPHRTHHCVSLGFLASMETISPLLPQSFRATVNEKSNQQA